MNDSFDLNQHQAATLASQGIALMKTGDGYQISPRAMNSPLCGSDVSVLIPVYNRTKYLAGCLAAVRAAAPAAHVEVIDDCSRPELSAQIEQIARNAGVFYHRNETNLVSGVLQACVDRSKREWVHILHDDDLVRPGFYDDLRGDVTLCGCAFIDEVGHLVNLMPLELSEAGFIPDWPARISAGQRVQMCCAIVRKSAYDAVGGFATEIGPALDWDMWIRLADRPTWYRPAILGAYRLHADSHSVQIGAEGMRKATLAVIEAAEARAGTRLELARRYYAVA